MSQSFYPFQFVGIDTATRDEYLEETLIYRFSSTKSGHRYTVIAEHYIENMYCVKFFDESVKLSFGKFSQLSGTYEPRTIIRTVAEIALDIYRRDPKASFAFVGAADEKDDSGKNTRRFRVYTMFVRDFEIEERFWPLFDKDNSLCVFINRESVPDRDIYEKRILSFIR